MYTPIGTYYSFYMAVCYRGWIVPIQPLHLTIVISTNFCIHTVLPPDDGLRYT
jgi:hypothetical protein